MRTQHKEIIGPTRRPPSKKGARAAAARAGSIDSVLDVPFGGVPEEHAEEEEDDWAEEELAVFERHPEASRPFVGYVVGKAKWAYLMREHEGLAGELEALGNRESELGAECDELLRRVMRNEVGSVVPFVGERGVGPDCCSLLQGRPDGSDKRDLAGKLPHRLYVALPPRQTTGSN